jgi:cytochrome b involved in lipid metabolism
MHPGGEKIVKAFGTNITELWRKYTQNYTHQYIKQTAYIMG